MCRKSQQLSEKFSKLNLLHKLILAFAICPRFVFASVGYWDLLGNS